MEIKKGRFCLNYSFKTTSPMKNAIVFLIFATISCSALAQCNADLYLNTQEDIDQFLIDYVGCTDWTGSIEILVSGQESLDATGTVGTPISDLDGLQNLEYIYSLTIWVEHNYDIPFSIAGLSNLISAEYIYFQGLNDYNGLQNLETVSGSMTLLCGPTQNIWPVDLTDVPRFDLFESLTSVGDLNIWAADFDFSDVTGAFPALTTANLISFPRMHFGTFEGFQNVSSLGAFDIGMNLETNFCGHLNVLNNLESIGTIDFYDLHIFTFNSFQSLTYADGIASEVRPLSTPTVVEFPELTNCGALFLAALCNTPDGFVNYNFNELETIEYVGEGAGYLHLWLGTNCGDMPHQVNLNSLVSVEGFVELWESGFVISAPLLHTIHGSGSSPYNGSLIIDISYISSLDFLSALETVTGSITVTGNTLLTDCDVEILCEKLSNTPELVTINNNAPGCMDATEVSLSCGESSVAGIVFADLDCDGVFNNSDVTLSNPVLLDLNGTPIGSSNGAGQYFIPLDENSSLTYVPQTPDGLLPTSSSTIITGATPEAVTGQNIGLCIDPNVHNLMLNLVPTAGPRPGFENRYVLLVTNQSGNTESATLVFNMVNMYGASIIDADGGVINGGTITWDIPAIIGFETLDFEVTLLVNASTPLGINYTCSSAVALQGNIDLDLSNNSETLTQQVTGSYDPNDIQVNIEEYEHVLLSQDEGLDLEYTIRFQNTGTAPAEFVIVKDIIEEDLSLGSIQMISASHPYELRFNENREVEWFFDNIQLPDSTTDLEGSQGYIHYRIKTNPALAMNDIIENTASIYFDYNAPVITNTATTVFYECPEELAITTEGSNCPGEYIVVLATYGWDEFYWTVDDIYSGSGLGISIDNAVSGTYSISCDASTEYCAAHQVFELTINEQPVTPIITQNGNFLVATGSGLFTWSLNGNVLDDTNNTIEITESGSYGVMVTSNGCDSEITTAEFLYVGVEEGQLKNMIVYPNPTTDFITIVLPQGATDNAIIITDAMGKVVKRMENLNVNQLTIDCSDWATGIYEVRCGEWNRAFIRN
jgi:hypothetical protein